MAKIYLKAVLIMKSPCANGPIKDDLLFVKKNSYNQNTDEDSNNLSTTSINKWKTSENDVIRITETPNNNDVISDNLVATTWKSKFRTNTASFKLGSTET